MRIRRFLGGCAVTAVALIGAAGLPAQADDRPLTFEKTLVIPGVPVGPYSDTLAVDIPGHRVFATPQAAKSVAVIDIPSGRVLKMIGGFGKLQAVYYWAPLDRIFVADGGAGLLKVYDGKNYALLGTVALAVGADSIAADAKRGLLYVGNGGEDANMDHSLVSVVDPAKLTKTADIVIPARGLEAIAVSSDGQTLFANLVDDAAVAAVDLISHRVIGVWALPSKDLYPFAVTADTPHSRLYITCRVDKEHFGIGGRLVVMDSANGKVLKTISIGGWADGVFFDHKRNRLYVTTGVGAVDTFSVGSDDALTRLPDTEIPLIAKHGVYSEETGELFVDAPHLASTQAQVVVLKASP